jgi:hypothetical protein
MERPKTQILVCGDVEGKFDQLFARVEEIRKKQRFDVLFCVGKFLENEKLGDSLEAYTSGLRVAPITTYVLLSAAEAALFPPDIAQGGELCPNVHALGPMGLKEIHGLSVAYYAATTGANDMEEHAKERLVQFLASFAKQSFKGVDVLLTNQWPKAVLNCVYESIAVTLFIVFRFCSPFVMMLSFVILCSALVLRAICPSLACPCWSMTAWVTTPSPRPRAPVCRATTSRPSRRRTSTSSDSRTRMCANSPTGGTFVCLVCGKGCFFLLFQYLIHSFS